ncbi:titin-like protein [Iris pallida]|uniref:Titin-like protein n=1 Tax=Iris pallida TaxID=29817 RepID=A0AAX6HCB7_IRIPA|nr:titin-like protein [Iris pallida]
MEGFGSSGFGAVNSVSKKRRSTTSRRPRPDSQFIVENRDASSHSSPPSSGNGSKLSPGQNVGYDACFRRKELNLNRSNPKIASTNNTDGTSASRKVRKVDRKYGDLSGFYGNASSKGAQPGHGSDLRRCSEGVLAPANWKNPSKVREKFDVRSRSPEGLGGRHGDGHSSGYAVGDSGGSTENKLKKVKLKVGGVTTTIHAKSNSEMNNTASTAKPSQSSDASRHRHKLILQDNSDDDNTSREKGDGVQGVSWRDNNGGGFPRVSKDGSRGKASEEGLSGKQVPFSEPVRKSKRVPKRRVLDGALDEGHNDNEIRYLEKLKTAKISTDFIPEFEDDGGESVKKKNILKVPKCRKTGYDVDEDYSSSRSARENRRRLRAGRGSDDTDYIDEEEPGSDDEIDPKGKKQKKECVDTSTDAIIQHHTTRQRAFQSGKDASSGASLIEFPNGLPPAPPRKQKEKLSEVEQQAKKAEAAQRRRMQVEKATRELEAEAIRKILGQDSNRKKKEDKMRKERDEMAQKKAAEYLVLSSNTIRWVMGPSGTTVTFGEEVGLPSIFKPQTCSYPPPREKCAGPSCTNTYKYRDSKLNLPLCSLHCYKAVRESSRQLSTC